MHVVDLPLLADVDVAATQSVLTALQKTPELSLFYKLVRFECIYSSHADGGRGRFVRVFVGFAMGGRCGVYPHPCHPPFLARA